MMKTLAILSALFVATSAFQVHPIVLAADWTNLEGDEKDQYEGSSYSSLVWDFGKENNEEFKVEGWKAIKYKQDETGTYVVYQLGGDLSEPIEVLFSEPAGGARSVVYVKDPEGAWCFGCEELANKITLASMIVLIMTVIINY